MDKPNKYLNMVIGSSAGLMTPVIITSGIKAIGFATAGIKASTIASSMMAYGMGTTPHIVSVCQSIGASGSLIGGIGLVPTIGLISSASYLIYKLDVVNWTKNKMTNIKSNL